MYIFKHLATKIRCIIIIQYICYTQHARFHSNRSCDTELIITIDEFAECLNKRSQCDVLALDFSNAFDGVPHSYLFKSETALLLGVWAYIVMALDFSN